MNQPPTPDYQKIGAAWEITARQQGQTITVLTAELALVRGQLQEAQDQIGKLTAEAQDIATLLCDEAVRLCSAVDPREPSVVEKEGK